jgi:hypothetical protein
LLVNELQVWAVMERPLSDPGVANLPDYSYGALGYVNHADHGPPLAFRRRWNIPDVYTRMVEIPLWPLAIPFVIKGYAACMRVRRHQRVRRLILQHLCPSCRYDLTGNVSGVCPECGMKIAEAK